MLRCDSRLDEGYLPSISSAIYTLDRVNHFRQLQNAHSATCIGNVHFHMEHDDRCGPFLAKGKLIAQASGLYPNMQIETF